MAPDILIVDSIQTVYKRDLTAAPGGTTQIKECAMSLMQYAKNKNVTIFIVGHVNKEGTLAVPKFWSIWWIVCCILREKPQDRSAVCVQRKTVMVPPMKSVYLK